ncbi:MAG: PilN domain-containing protein [Deltaproteobacteria bacterium]|jgi:Tfp pilus assembly protein PilN|nr:PilN domain-containing protein [Deltaproteobacteria bacterium]
MMIKINLLPIEAFRQSASGQLSVTIFSFVMVALGIGLFLFKTTMMDPKVTDLQTQKDSKNAELASMKTQSEEALKQTTQFTTQLIQADAIAELEERRRDQTRLFNAIAGEVINQASWLTSFTHDRGVVTIRGMATDHEVVASFLDNLERTPLLHDIDLIRAARDTTINNVSLVTFEIRGGTVFPEASLMEKGLPDVDLPGRTEITQLVSTAAPGLGETLTKSRAATKAAL